MKTGIFGGAFNPVHNGHIALAKHYMTSLGLERIIFIPTHIPPHKTDELLASEADRINMLAVALSGFDNFEIDDCEFKREGKSYTYDTVAYLKNKYPEDDFEKSFSAYSDYDSTNSLDAVESTLCQEIIDKLVEDMFNASVAQW